MKRLLCIISSLDAGGAETFLMKVYRSLPIEEYQLDFVVSVPNGCYTKEVLERGGKIFEIPKRTEDLKGVYKSIKRIVKENGYDAVLKLGENSLSVIDLIAAKKGGARHLALRSCNAPTGLSFKSRAIHKLFRPLLNRISTVKLAPSDLAAEFMFGKRTDVKLLNNGVDLNVFCFQPVERQKIREEFSICNKFVVGHVGRFYHQKNHKYLIEVFKKISEKRDDAVLMLVGIGPLESEIRTLVSEMGLKEKVIFAGQRFDIPALLSAMDVFVFPSFHEGMPNTVIEAQATGLPCVIADTITREADITGLVQYLPLSENADYWSEKALSAVLTERKNTYSDFTEHGYNIKDVANELVEIIWK